VELGATAQVFKPGHRLRVEITSSDFPRYDRNLNTGGPIATETAGQVAVNTVMHDPMRASHLVLPELR
jgi:putative CocE/NonD family hydrolase